MVLKAKGRRRQLGSGRRAMTPLTVAAATLLGMSELALAGDGAADTTQVQSGKGADQVLLKKMEAMERRIKSLEFSQINKRMRRHVPKSTAAISLDGKPRSKASRTLLLHRGRSGR